MYKKLLSMVGAGAMLGMVAFGGSAMAFGHHGGGHHGDDDFGLLARAAGITHEQIRTAFKNDTALKTDFQTLMTTKKAMDSCIISAASATACNSQIQAYAAAQQALTTEKNTVWAGLFANAPKKSAAATLKGQLDALKTTAHQDIRAALGSSSSSDSPDSPTAEQ